MKKIISLSILSIFIFACGGDKNGALGEKTISGDITNLTEGTYIYLDLVTPKEVITKDSAEIDKNGNYAFHYQLEDIAYYRLRINNQNFINLILEKGEHPIINGDGTNLMDSYSVEGSKQSKELKTLNLMFKENELTQDSINRVFQANRSDQNLFIELQRAAHASTAKMNTYFIGLIEKDPSSLISLAAVQQLDIKSYGRFFKKVDEEMGKKLPNSPYYIAFHQKMESIVNIFVGELAPDFTLNNKNGEPVSLSSLKGNIVLLDFWASWCRPCRAENPNVVKVYNKYHNKGFDVMSISLDGMPQQKNAKQDWLDAINKDGLIWKNHVSELKGWNSEIVKMYGIEGIPFTLLIDKEGIIIGKNLRREDLENKLAQLFK